ncbi:CiaD-like domain-containing protein [Hydrogenimonas sp.]
MELKDVILSTIAELGEEPREEKEERSSEFPDTEKTEESSSSSPKIGENDSVSKNEEGEKTSLEEEREFLEHVRERIIVLFEGFQSPNNERLEAKIDLTLNFLEYLLATLDERIETLKKR